MIENTRRGGVLALGASLLLLSLQGLQGLQAVEVRIGDITNVVGNRTNTIQGVGLVVGLAGTGGKTPQTREKLMNYLQHYGARIDPLMRSLIANNTQQKTDNISLVYVTAELPVDALPGSVLDVTVATLDDAENLDGGELVNTPLYGYDGIESDIYAMARGKVLVSGFSVGGANASATKNHPTTGRVVGGAKVEKTISSGISRQTTLRLQLLYPDFTTADRITKAIGRKYPGTTRTLDRSTIEVLVPRRELMDVSGFISQLQDIRVEPDMRARIVINERTGTVVVNRNVRLSPTSVSHGSLQVTVAETPVVSQAQPFAPGGRTVEDSTTNLNVNEERRPFVVLAPGPTVGELANALNALGATPRDISAIFQALAESGALHATIVTQWSRRHGAAKGRAFFSHPERRIRGLPASIFRHRPPG